MGRIAGEKYQHVAIIVSYFIYCLGARYSMQKQREVRLLSELVYYSLNVLVGPRQTLGEEYCDILMVDILITHLQSIFFYYNILTFLYFK